MAYRRVSLAGASGGRLAHARGRQLTVGTRSRYIRALVPIMRRGEPTIFALEGPFRAYVRARLCLKGWHWRAADDAADDVVTAALNRAGAQRPPWKEGQPEWTQDGAVLQERTRCVNCGAPLPEGHRKFCGTLCGDSFHQRVYRAVKAREVAALKGFENELS